MYSGAFHPLRAIVINSNLKWEKIAIGERNHKVQELKLMNIHSSSHLKLYLRAGLAVVTQEVRNTMAQKRSYY